MLRVFELKTGDEIKESREKHEESPWRNRPVAESLKLFEDMRRGLVEEGAATLRLKQDMRNQNPNMYDLIAYRIKVSARLCHCMEVPVTVSEYGVVCVTVGRGLVEEGGGYCAPAGDRTPTCKTSSHAASRSVPYCVTVPVSLCHCIEG